MEEGKKGKEQKQEQKPRWSGRHEEGVEETFLGLLPAVPLASKSKWLRQSMHYITRFTFTTNRHDDAHSLRRSPLRRGRRAKRARSSLIPPTTFWRPPKPYSTGRERKAAHAFEARRPGCIMEMETDTGTGARARYRTWSGFPLTLAVEKALEKEVMRDGRRDTHHTPSCISTTSKTLHPRPLFGTQPN